MLDACGVTAPASCCHSEAIHREECAGDHRTRPHPWEKCVRWPLIASVGLLLFKAAVAAQPDEVRVGIVSDGPSPRPLLSAELLMREANRVYGENHRFVVPAGADLDGGWSLAGVTAAINRLEADPKIDVVVTLGLVASHVAAHATRLPKPTVAANVVDPILQAFPLAAGGSGRRQFTYVATFKSVDEELRTFQRLVGFARLVILIDPLSLEAIPELRQKATALERALGIRITLIPTATVDDAVNALPGDAEAVYVAPLLRLSHSQVEALAAALNARRLISFSRLGGAELADGLLLTAEPAVADAERLARRIALDIQRIRDGEDAGRLNVAFPLEHRLGINMATARAIGYSPRWDDLSDAVIVNEEPPSSEPPLSLLTAIQAATRDNPALSASQIGVDIASAQISSARSALLPSLDASASATQIDKSHASPLIQAEKTAAASGVFQQLIYSDKTWAAYAVAQRLKNAAGQQYEQDLLDTIEQTAVAYLSALRAKSVEAVRRQDTENRRKNLEVARVRETIGLSERSDYLRWVSETATARRDLLDAAAATRLAITEVARLTHYSGPGRPRISEVDLDDPMRWMSDPRTQQYLDTPAKWEIFSSYAVEAAVTRAPELKRLDELLLGQERLVTSARRSFYFPDLALVASGADAFQRSGAGSMRVSGAPGATSWTVTLQATLPIFSSGAQSAELAHASHTARQIGAQRAATVDAVRARAQAALDQLSASYPSIRLAEQAAAAARENFDKSSDAYGRGLVTVTDLISAQDAYLAADLARAQASYTFLIDFVTTLRAAGSFDLLLDPGSRASWYDRVDRWFHEHRGATGAP